MFKNYKPAGPIAAKFHQSRAKFKGLMGPVGSGKSTACINEILAVAGRQNVGRDGRRTSRIAIFRNTYLELEATTIKSWEQWVPKNIGTWYAKEPYRHIIIDKNLNMEVYFIAVDRPEQVKKILSMELTMAWLNEVKELPKSLAEACIARVGRYPPVSEGGCNWAGMIVDTNPPDTDHFYYKWAEEKKYFGTLHLVGLTRVLGEEGAKVHIDYLIRKKVIEETEEGYGIIKGDKSFYDEYHERLTPDMMKFLYQSVYEYFRQPGGLSEGAENLGHLPSDYYTAPLGQNSKDWINVYIHGQYGAVHEGQPVFPDYKEEIHCKPVFYDKTLPLYIGVDFGFSSAAVFGQITADGRVHWIDELVSENIDLPKFGKLLKEKVAREYPDANIFGYGDPAGMNKSSLGDTTAFQVINKATGLNFQPAPGLNNNDIMLRVASVSNPMRGLSKGGPTFQISPKCTMTRKGLAGGYCYKRKAVVGSEQYHDVPDKNKYSHPCDAGQYLNIGMGLGRELTGGGKGFKMKDAEVIDYYEIGGS